MITTLVEPELQPQGGLTPPRPPQRTLVGTDDEEKRPCQHCGHTKAEHLGGPYCTGKVRFTPGSMTGNIAAGPGVNVTTTGTSMNCTCRNYEPKRTEK